MKIKKSSLLVVLFLTTILIMGICAKSQFVHAKEATKKIRINNTILEFKDIVYVDGQKGNDSDGDGSKSNPFKTVSMGFTYLNKNCREDGAIVVEDGVYDMLNVVGINWYDNLQEQYTGMKVSIIASTMGKVTLKNCPEWTTREYNKNNKVKINMYGIILNFRNDISNGGDLGLDDWVNEYYNCVFPANHYRVWYSSDIDTKVKVVNCLFMGNQHKVSQNGAPGIAINCASKVQTFEPSQGDIRNCLYNVTLDDQYHITSDGWEHAGIGMNPDGTKANIGVYGGQFAWGSKVEEVNNELKLVLEVGEEIPLSVTEDLEDNTAMVWTSSKEQVATVDQMGLVKALSEGNTTVTVTSADGTYADTIKIIVVNTAKELRLAVDLNVDRTCRFTVDDLEDRTSVEWSTLNTEVAIVSDKGKVTAKGKGLTVVIAKDLEGNVIGQIYIRVR